MQNKDEENRPCFAYISKLSNWGKCRRRDLLLSNKFETAKSGFLNHKIRKNRLINLLDSFLCSPLLFIVFLHISFVRRADTFLLIRFSLPSGKASCFVFVYCFFQITGVLPSVS